MTKHQQTLILTDDEIVNNYINMPTKIGHTIIGIDDKWYKIIDIVYNMKSCYTIYILEEISPYSFPTTE